LISRFSRLRTDGEQRIAFAHGETMTSPYSSGGGGTHLEARVAASCLAAILCEAGVRGLPGQFATRVLGQRADFDDPLDDLIIEGIRSDGRKTQLDLQVKNKLTFTDNDPEWVDVLKRAWNTVSKASFDAPCRRVGVAIGAFNARVEQHYQSILKWAEESADAAHFFERIGKGDYSHKDKQAFVATVRAVVAAHINRAPDNDEIWRFLKVLVIIHYDFQSAAASRDAEHVIERLKGVLAPEHRSKANRIWDHLVAKAGEMLPVGGGATRATLEQALLSEDFNIGPAPSFWKDIQSLHLESQRALSDIKSDIHGLKLHRSTSYQKVREALVEGRLVQIDGEPGTGKSAVLKQVAEECARNGPVLVLKDARIRAQGWSTHAHALGVSGDVAALLREFACVGEPILFIDGIDKITDPAVQLTVNDVIRSIANDDSLGAWRILATIREQNLKHLETWLDSAAIKKLPIRTVAVGPLDDTELLVVAEAFPRLRPLLSQAGNSDVILRRPFFLNALLSLAASKGAETLPATEVELLNLWWEMGGSDRPDFSLAQHRRNLLIALAEALSQAPNTGVPIRMLPPEPLAELKSSGVVRDKELGHSVVFTHDIYEEWALCEYLIGQQSEIAGLLKATREPDVLIRPIQLLGAYVLETSADPTPWKALLANVADATLRPVWHRTVLTSCLQSTQTTQLLEKLNDDLFANGGEQLRKLLLAMTTVEVMPNRLFLNAQLTPDLEPDERARYAHLTAVPKARTWLRFLAWLMSKMENLPPSLIMDVVPAFKTWQDAYAGQRVRYCQQIGEICYSWLKEIEQCVHPRDFRGYRAPFDGALRGEDDAEKAIRAVFLVSAGDVPGLVTEYLQTKAADREHAHMFTSAIVNNSGALIRHLPSQFADYLLAVLLEDPDEDDDPLGGRSLIDDDFGIADHREFYPASPVQPPFLNLLKLHPEEGLRLIHRMCNHAMAAWRKGSRRYRSWSEPLTPIPISLAFPWGTQTFWGDNRVYQWFRGVWGNHAIESALMALEQWALERLDKDAPFDEIFRSVIENNESVAALGIGVSLCLAHPQKSLSCAFPLVTCPYLWEWDIARFMYDRMPTNIMGNWHLDRHLLSAVKDLNQRPHRMQEMRQLVPYFVCSGDAALVKAFTKGVRRFPRHLPISYEEEKKNADHIAALREKMKLFAEQADPQYFRAAQTEDGKHIKIWNEPPSLEKKKYKEQQRRHIQMTEYLGVAMWANKSLESGKLEEGFAIADALAKVRNWDFPDLFDIRTDEIEDRHRVAAVAGTAFVAARFCAPENWTKELAEWCLDVFQRAATGPESPDDLNVRMAVMLMHPAVYAAHGYAALLARDYETERCQQALLNLAIDAMEGVQAAVFKSAKYYAAAQSDFYWVLLDLGFQQCVANRDFLPDHHIIIWDQSEADAQLALLERAEGFLRSKTTPALPAIPMPWVKIDKAAGRGRQKTDGYGRNELVFRYDLAEKIIPEICFEPVLTHSERRCQFVRLVSDMLDYTLQELVPPFAESKRDHNHHTPFEWVYDFSSWLGSVCVELNQEEAEQILTRVWSQDDTESILIIMQSLMRRFMVRAFLNPADIKAEHLVLWSRMIDWLFQSDEWKYNKTEDYLDREFTSCAFTSLFCLAPDFSPLLCGIDPGWPHLDKFLPIIERAICEFGVNVNLYLAVITFLKRGGMDLMPEPALKWLLSVVQDRKADQEFWGPNGERTVELLKQVLSEKGRNLTPDHRKSIALIADILTDNGVRGAGFLQQELLRAA
jgi:hypothetical protein